MERAVTLETTRIDDLFEVMLAAAAEMEGAAWSAWGPGRTRQLWGDDRVWYSYEERDRDGWLCACGVELRRAREQGEQARKVGGMDARRTGIPAGVAVTFWGEDALLAQLRARLAVMWKGLDAQSQAAGSYGAHGSTLDRVREARELVERGMGKTKACKRAHIDTRTYDRYVETLIDWDE